MGLPTRSFEKQHAMRQHCDWVPLPILPITSWSACLLEQLEAGLRMRMSITGCRSTTTSGANTLLARYTKLVISESSFHVRPFASTDTKFACRTQLGFSSRGRGLNRLRRPVRFDGTSSASTFFRISLDLINNKKKIKKIKLKSNNSVAASTLRR